MIKAMLAAALVAALTLINPAKHPRRDATYSTSFERTNTWYSAPLRRCFRATLSGTLRATYRAAGAGRAMVFSFGRPEIVSPVVHVDVFADCTLTTAADVRRLELRQSYYDGQCEHEPALGARSATSNSFSIGLSTTSACGRFSTVSRSSRYGAGSSYEQNASAGRAVWPEKRTFWQGGYKRTSTCLTSEYDLQPYVSATKTARFRHRFADICISM